MINAIGIALTGLDSAVKKLNAGAANIANLQTVGSLDSSGPAPYAPVTTVQQTITDNQGGVLGVRTDVVPRTDPYYPAFIPDSPFANAEGLVGVPNIDLAGELVNLKIAETAYKANLATIRVSSALSEDLFRAVDKKA